MSTVTRSPRPRTVKAVRLLNTESDQIGPHEYGLHESAEAARRTGREMNRVIRRTCGTPKRFTTKATTLTFTGGDAFTSVEFECGRWARDWTPRSPLDLLPLAGKYCSEQITCWEYEEHEKVTTTREEAFRETAAFNRSVLADFQQGRDFLWRVVVEVGAPIVPGYGRFQLGGSVGYVDLSFELAIRMVKPTREEIVLYATKGGAA